jgi:NET1-associated nuclear protein 1 (U3 small nucleolar RNA-associated protein 17)
LRVITDKGRGFVNGSAITSQQLLKGEDTTQRQETAVEDAAEDQVGIDGRSDDEHPPWLPLQLATAAYDDDSPPVVRQEQLAEIFDVGPSYAPLNVSELFERVVGLFARKPVPRI